MSASASSNFGRTLPLGAHLPPFGQPDHVIPSIQDRAQCAAVFGAEAKSCDHDEPFAAIIRWTADPAKMDRRTRSKWLCELRYAAERKTNAEPLATFIRR
jgi:hypothetical protein